MTQQIPKEAADKLKIYLAPIAKLFKSPLITIIVRSREPGNTVGDLVLTNDNPTAVINTLRAHMVAEAQRFADEGERSGRDPDAAFPVQRDSSDPLR